MDKSEKALENGSGNAVLLSADGVSACYNGRKVLHKVSVVFKRGRVTAIAGPNGSGKSTLLKTLTGIVPKKEGKIYVGEILSDKLSSLEKARHIAYLPQLKNIPDLTVKTMVLHGRFSHLSYPRRYRKEDLAAVDKALETTGLTEYAEKNVSSLSGGTVQLVFLAMALAQSTEVILLDEPTSFLDISHQIKLMELCRSLAADGKAIAAVMHDIPLTLKYADELIVMKDGCVAASGTADEVYKSGILNDVFNVKIKEVKTETGKIYYCE